MPNANLLLASRFDGAGYPDFSVVWPDFDFPAAAGVNLSGWGRPVVDGHGFGLPSRSIGNVTWRAVEQKAPGRSLYQADLFARWKNAGGAARREVGLMVRVRDVLNCFVVRVRSMGPAACELRLFQVAAGVETQRGATYTGAGLSATQLNAGFRWRARVEDLPSGDLLVRCYLAPTGATGKGTLVLEWSGDPGICAGQFGAGIELRDLVSGDDVRVDDLEVYDTADEIDPVVVAAGAGWALGIGSTVYSMDGLAGLSPRAKLLRVRQAFGLKGNSCHLQVDGDFRIGSLLKPGAAIVAYHDGVVRFRGWVEDGAIDATPERQVWNCYDGYFAARQIPLREDNGTPGLKFNVTDDQSEDFDANRQGMTVGAILKFLFDRYLARLRFYGCAPSDALPYSATELASIDAVVNDVYVTGTFVAAVETLLRYVGHKFQVWWNPATLVWAFRDTTAATPVAIEFTADWVQLKVNPDRTKAYNAVEWVGAAPAQLPTLDLSVAAGDLLPAWTKEMEGKYGPEKRSKTILSCQNVASGTGVAPDGVNRNYIDIDAGLADQDDLRGWLVDVVGYARLVTNNSATRIWLSSPAWAAPPANGTTFVFTATDENSLAILSSQGVGRGYYLARPVTTGTGCAGGAGGKGGFGQQGFCGEALTQQLGADGKTKFGENLSYTVKFPNAFQQAAGFCNPILELAEKPKAFWFGPFLIQPKGSVPQGYCSQPDATPSPINVVVKVPVRGNAPYLREPPAADSFEGTAFTEWGSRQVYTVNDPDFVLQSQDVGLRKAAQMILAVKKDKPFLLSVARAANWHVTTPEKPLRARTTDFADLKARVLLTSALRATGFEATEKLAVFGVTWDVEQSLETIECGSTAGWLEASGIDIARGISEARVLKRALTEVKRLEDFRNAFLAKPADRVGGQLKGATQACSIPVSDTQALGVSSVQDHDQKKVGQLTQASMREVLDASLMMGVEAKFPGSPVSIPGRDGAAAQQVVDGPALRALGDPLIPFQGPVPGPGGSLGYYGGGIVTDEKLSGDPPDVVRRFGGLIFRKQQDAAGNRKGGPGLEWSRTDSSGNPTGGWSAYRKPSDLPGGVAPVSILSPGSIGDQLLARSRELARALGRVEDGVRLLAPGDRNAAFPLGAPADLATTLRVPGILSGFTLVPESFADPGGPVWAGPKSASGVDSQTFWRVKTPELLLVKVNSVAAGTGDNGGGWTIDTSGPGGSTPFASSGSVAHKQVHASDMSPDLSKLGGAALTPAQNAFGFTLEGWCLNAGGGGAVDAVGGVVAVPKGAVGIPVVTVTLEEDAVAGAPPGAGATYRVFCQYQYKASAWGASGAGATAPQSVPVANGAATGSAVYFSPIGAVPAGLRAIAVSAIYAPGAPGTAPANKSLTVIGIDVDLAVIEGGYAILARDGATAHDAWAHTMPFMVEFASLLDSWSLVFTKALAEGVSLGETWDFELNAPLEMFESSHVSESWFLELNGVPVFP